MQELELKIARRDEESEYDYMIMKQDLL